MAREGEGAGYNGYANYQTWNVALWIDNEYPLYQESREMARAALAEADDDAKAAVDTLEERLQDWIEEMAPYSGASLWSDLLTHALALVDWHEIAENYVEEVQEAARI